jgi:hypothetical protein
MTAEILEMPNWNPLLARLNPADCGAFMYMGHIGPVHLYKHIITRRYLNLDSEGNCYVWDGKGEGEENYLPAVFSEQLLRTKGGTVEF